MSIDSIGPKIMIHKSTEFSLEASIAQRYGDTLKQSAQKDIDTQTERSAKEVLESQQAEQARIHREKERNKRGKKDAAPGQEAAMEYRRGQKQEKDGLEVAQDEHIIDIRI